MNQPQRLTEKHLLATVANFPEAVRKDDSNRSYFLSVAIIKYFLGEDWLELHCAPNALTGIFRQDFSEEVAGEERAFKLVDLAELLFNLQHVDGFDGCIDRMKAGAVEGTLAELDFGRMLLMNCVTFRFVQPRGEKGNDYDIEIVLADGTTICADAKCKLESTEFSEETVRASFEKARTQFPANRPSVIFLKVPNHWLRKLNKGLELRSLAVRWLKGSTQRVVSIKFYTTDAIYLNGVMSQIIAFDEINNPHNRFDASRDWGLFDATPDQRGLPEIWKRILYFPKPVREA